MKAHLDQAIVAGIDLLSVAYVQLGLHMTKRKDWCTQSITGDQDAIINTLPYMQ